jgi:hypothetical protein
MRASVRRSISFGLLCVLAFLVAASAAGLYSYTDAELQGPVQPIVFSHQVHSTKLEMDCLYCHDGATRSQHASIPAVSSCMGCHQWVKKGTSEGSVEEIAKIFQHYCGKSECPPWTLPGPGARPVAWIRIHNLPEHVQFKHNRHMLVENLKCQDCHGAVETMNRVYLTPDRKLRPRSLWLPAAKLEMGWCVECHERLEATIDCVTCHF